MVQTWALGSHTSGKAATGQKRAFGLHDSGEKAGTGWGDARRAENKSAQLAGASWGAARTVFFVLALLILFGGFTVMRTFAASEQVLAETNAELVVYMDTGDTLWRLAASSKKESMDIREAVHLLMERNSLTSPVVQSGQKIIVPSSILP